MTCTKGHTKVVHLNYVHKDINCNRMEHTKLNSAVLSTMISDRSIQTIIVNCIVHKKVINCIFANKIAIVYRTDVHCNSCQLQ